MLTAPRPATAGEAGVVSVLAVRLGLAPTDCQYGHGLRNGCVTNPCRGRAAVRVPGPAEARISAGARTRRRVRGARIARGPRTGAPLDSPPWRLPGSASS